MSRDRDDRCDDDADDDRAWKRHWASAPWWTGWYGESGSLLAQRVIRRTARYYGDLADLTGSGAVEPRLWIGTLQRYWSGLAEDYGDYLKVASGWERAGDLIEVGETEPPILRIDLVQGSKTASARIELPERLRDGSTKEVVLRTAGFASASRRVLHPERHVRFEPATVTPGKPSKILLHDLPDDLQAGMQLTGLVTAHRIPGHDEDDAGPKPAPVLVAVVQLRIV